MPNNIPNLGWLFYKDYFADLQAELRRTGGGEKVNNLRLGLAEKNTKITAQTLKNYPTHLLAVSGANCTFQMRTAYPGFLAGLGAQHSIGHEEELKLGFNFDHTTGLPFLPGSSVKGLLRSVFPSRLRAAADTDLPPQVVAGLRAKANALQTLLVNVLQLEARGVPEAQCANFLTALEQHIFAGERGEEAEVPTESIYDRDIFYDAYPTTSHFRGNTAADAGRFLGIGAITPHGKNPLKNPIPLRLLKILPEVVFQFQFTLHSSQIMGITISQLDKLQLFKTILELQGVGAKTNVGYGHGEMVS